MFIFNFLLLLFSHSVNSALYIYHLYTMLLENSLYNCGSEIVFSIIIDYCGNGCCKISASKNI